MNRYIALLRGINISGKNKISMAELKEQFLQLGMNDVITYLNSGNVIFSSEDTDVDLLTRKIETMLKTSFHLDIPILVILQNKLADQLSHAPGWWGNDNKEIYDNLIFIMPPLQSDDICKAIGSPKEGLEQIHPFGNLIFWSFSLKDYQKTNWWSRTANSEVKDTITIRTANTVRKIINM